MADTLFKEAGYTLGGLMEFIELGEIGLPDIQRPFVWKNAKVRDLFDSMYQGFPIGYLLFWESSADVNTRTIGADTKQKAPRLLVVDGQQRLTSLYAVIKGIPVIRENYNKELIEIAFNPLQAKFEVADAAIRLDKTYIPNISKLWSKNLNIFAITGNYLENLKAVRDVTEEEINTVQNSIMRLHNLLSYPFRALELSATISEEQVSEVFVRINSKGKALNQSDFILTLMSVFWDDGRKQLEKFSFDARQPTAGKSSSFNHFIEVMPDQLLRVSVGLGFRRARLQYVYSILRGKDLETEVFSDELRAKQFGVLKDAQARVLNLQYWHDFFKILVQAGYRSGSMISSESNLLFAYALYLIGRTEYKADEFQLRNVMARWFFMSSLTGRYSSSPESKMEYDYARLRNIKTSEDFLALLDGICKESLTSDYWSLTLPNEMATSSPRSPSLFAYYAALNLLDARALFSRVKVSELLDPATQAQRSALERHHLFPKKFLKDKGFTETRDVNQIANYALVEWGDNSRISSQAPAEYVPFLKERFDNREIERMYHWHGLPDNWENMSYLDFLMARRELMAAIIKEGYAALCDTEKEKMTGRYVSLAQLIPSGESSSTEFKSTLRMNLHTGQKDPRMELGCLKTIAGFLNVNGGTLLIGISDDGEVVGIDADKFENEDKMVLHLVNLIRDRVSPHHMIYVHPRFEDHEGKRVLAVECVPSKSPAYLKEDGVEKFYIRTGAATTELNLSQVQEFIKQRFAA